MAPVINSVKLLVDDNMNQFLYTPFLAEEVRHALFDMISYKAPGPDGMSILFFQKFWNIVRRDVTTWVVQVLNERLC